MGDVGYFDENGALYVINRKSDVFNYENCKIYPSEIEDVLTEIEGIELACVVGVYDEKLKTYLTTAAIKLQSNSKVTKTSIIDYVAQKLELSKQLHGGVFFFDEMPMTANGKILKRAVIERIILERK